MKLKRKSRNKIIGILTLLIVILCGILCFWHFKKPHNFKYLENIETIYAQVDAYAIYGTHMNLSGTLNISEQNNVKLILGNEKEEIEIPILTEYKNNLLHFNTSQEINNGINLEKLKTGEYFFLIKIENNNEKKYYSLENKTNYEDLTYYTLTQNKKNKKITMEWNTTIDFPSMNLKIKEEKLPSEVYDITIDPGHGGKDVGAVGKIKNQEYYERDLNLKTSLSLKSALEKMGYKVAITRENNDKVYIYQKNGSATLANDSKSKFNFAIHHNSNGVGTSFKGFEIYVANKINYKFAELLVSNITKETTISSSNKNAYKTEDGIYTRNFTEEEIAISKKDAAELNFEPFPITTETSYYYYIREVGGISTNAYNDGRNPDYPKNEYYNAFQTAEPYLLELGYVDDEFELNKIINQTENYAKSIANTLKEYLK